MDQILIEGIRIRPRIGVTARERRSRPRCSVDVAIDCDLSRPARSDSVEDTLDYDTVLREITRLAASREYCLLEALGQAIAEQVVGRPGVATVAVTVRKYGRRGLDAFGVRVKRRRSRRRGGP